MEWQPIETAPKDGSIFVTINCREPDEVEICRYEPFPWDGFKERPDGLYEKVTEIVSEWSSNNFHRATHWMPLPEPPQ